MERYERGRIGEVAAAIAREGEIRAHVGNELQNVVVPHADEVLEQLRRARLDAIRQERLVTRIDDRKRFCRIERAVGDVLQRLPIQTPNGRLCHHVGNGRIAEVEV